MQKKHRSLFFILICCLYFSPLYLNEEQVSSDFENILQKNNVIPADITFMLADLKYSSHDLKIVEFGGCFGAGFKVLDHLYGPGKVWRSFWKNLNRFQLPIIYVGSRKNLKKIAWKNFEKMGGHYFQSLKTFTDSSLFKQLQKQNSSKNIFLTSISDYKAIIVKKGYPGSKDEQRWFKENYPDYLFVNRTVRKYVNNKELADLLFNDKYLQQFRPKCRVFPRKYSRKLSKKIINDLQCDWYVIKPLRSSAGNGVIITEKSKLAHVLKLILDKYHNNLPYNNTTFFAPHKPLTYTYWKHAAFWSELL